MGLAVKVFVADSGDPQPPTGNVGRPGIPEPDL
jgi:hypothetical protein